MLDGRPILIVEDEAIIALGLAMAVRQAGGAVIGPAASVRDAFTLLDLHMVDAAIVDANLADRDVTPLAIKLFNHNIPFIVHTAAGLPPELTAALSDVPVVIKPAETEHVVATLLAVIEARMTYFTTAKLAS